MTEKEKKNKEEKAVEKALQTVEGAVKSIDTTSPEKMFEGYDTKITAALKKEGDWIEGKFLGKGEPETIMGQDGNPQMLATWEIDTGPTTVRLLGATHLDKQLDEVVNSGRAPCGIKILRGSQIDIAGGKRRMTQYFVGTKAL